MAKVKKFGEAVVITSEAKLEDIRKIAKYRPKALVVMGGEDGKEPVFAVGLSAKRSGSINSFSVDFGGCNEEGFAQVTVNYCGPDTDVKAHLADSIGPQISMLSQLEAAWPAVIAEIDAEVAGIMANIEVG